MALRSVPDHPKFHHLKSLLDCGRGEALGYLEALWHFCGKYTPQGDVGRYSDAQIEAWIEWRRGEPGSLIAALIASNWIEKSPTHRLIVHDWHDHADDATRLTLKRKRLDFVTRKGDTLATVSRQCPDSVPTVSGLPEPEPEPEPVSPPSPPPGEPVVVSPSEPKPKRKPKPDWHDDLGFQEFYAAFWRKVNPADAFKAYQGRCRSPGDHERIMAAMRRQTPEMLRREVSHRPYPASWLRAGGAESEPDSAAPVANGSDSGGGVMARILRKAVSGT